MRWIGIIAATFSLLAVIQLGGSLEAFINIPALLFVLLFAGGVVLATHGNDAVQCVRHWEGSRRTTNQSVADGFQIIETARQALIAAGWIGAIVGSVQLLGQLDDPASLGGGLATAILTLFYGYVLASLVCLPLSRKRHSDSAPAEGAMAKQPSSANAAGS